jgi:hypothetical protein
MSTGMGTMISFRIITHISMDQRLALWGVRRAGTSFAC